MLQSLYIYIYRLLKTGPIMGAHFSIRHLGLFFFLKEKPYCLVQKNTSVYTFFNHSIRLYLLFFIGTSINLNAQTQENLVPNPSFEHFSSAPIGWFYKGEHFTRVMKYWNAPTSASPDIFGPKVIIPKHWQEKGFGKQVARTGSTIVGITVYGFEEGKPHCREYIQIQLKEPLVIGQKYHFEFWVSNLSESLQVNRLGAYFSKEELRLIDDTIIEATPQVEAKNILASTNKSWMKIAANFIAKEEAAYVIIGNFYPDNETKTQKSRQNAYNYAYYYIDDVLLKKEKPIIKVPIKPDDLTKAHIETGKIIALKNIFYDTDKYELLPRSFVELNKLLALTQKYPDMVIEIRGHTDIIGNKDYNLYLSKKRAKSVVQYLIDKGVAPYRVQYKGFGSKLPIASNDTKEGRQMNRRVEFKIISNTNDMN